MEDELLDGFGRAVVAVAFTDGTRVIHPQPVGSIGSDFPFEQAVHIVTAFNPGGTVTDEASNESLHELLVDAVGKLGVETLSTIGSAPDGSIAEPGLLISGLGRDAAIELGRRFGQRAIYEWRRDGLEIVDIDTLASQVLGWRLV